jgi:hypothetical protein
MSCTAGTAFPWPRSGRTTGKEWLCTGTKRAVVVKQHEYAPGDVGVCLLGEGGTMKVREVKAWKMAATNP